MRRDFSESARQELLTLVKQVESEKWSDFTDWFGDRWCDFESWIGTLDIYSYIDNVNNYHKKVIDKNNTTADDINGIFTQVNNSSESYRGRFLAALTDLQSYRKTIDTMAEVVSPGKGLFTSEYVGSELKNAINAYLASHDLLKQITGEGLTSDTLAEVKDKDLLQQLLNTMGNTLVALLPNVTLGQKVEIPLGPDLTFYYEVTGQVDGNSDISINTVIEDQKLKISDVSLETEGDWNISGSYGADGEHSLSLGAENSNISFNFNNGMMETSASVVVGNNTHTITIRTGASSLELEKSVMTELEGGSVTSAMGIVLDKNSNWTHLPVPVPVEVSNSVNIPEFEIDWDTVGTIAVGAAVVYGIVYVGAAIYTGGGSLLVMPPPIPV